MQVINAPQKVTRSPAALERDLDRWTGTDGVSGVFTTESAAKARAAKLRERGWTASHGTGPGEGECAILTKDSVRKVIGFHLVELSEPGHRPGNVGRLVNGNYAPVVIVEGLASGRRTLLTDAHLRAHLEALWVRLDRDARTDVKQLLESADPVIRAWLQDVKAWRAAVNHFAAKYQVDDQIVAADWNLDGHDAWVQQLMVNLWPGLNMIVTDEPDLGNRSVGWILTTFDDAGSEVLDAKASDHDAGLFNLRHINQTPGHKPDPRRTPPDPFERCTYNGHLMDQKTKTAVQVLERGPLKDLAPLTIFQGCYNAGGVSASAGTHDGGGVLDFAPAFHERKCAAWRDRIGGPWWHREEIPGLWGEHGHCVMNNHGKLSPAAARQVVQYFQGLDGLADMARDPNQHHPRVGFDYVAEWQKLHAA